MATRIIDYEIGQPLPPLDNLEKYDYLRLHLFRGNRAIGKFTMRTGYRPVKREFVATQLAQYCAKELITEATGYNYDQASQKLVEDLLSGANSQSAAPTAPNSSAFAKVASTATQNETEPPDSDFRTTVSIVIPTCDRPDDLESCLSSLVKLESRHRFEIIVVDNRPESGLSRAVAQNFPVKYVAEGRAGASYARNAGVAHSCGEIIVFTDDDVTVTADWLDNLIAPFAEADVMCVSGLVLPLELETRAQELYEDYGEGGLERGFERRKVGREFFEQWRGAVQTWQLGGTANCAIRAEVFTRPEIGPFDEGLGAGVATGGGEDTYLFYRVLKAGYSCVYEPAALVYHRHRREMRALMRQLHGYSRGAVAQQLRILLTDKDRRALYQLLKVLPRWQFRRLFGRVSGAYYFPMRLILVEIWGNLLGLPGFFQAAQQAKKQGRFTPAVIAAERAKAQPLWLERK